MYIIQLVNDNLVKECYELAGPSYLPTGLTKSIVADPLKMDWPNPLKLD